MLTNMIESPLPAEAGTVLDLAPGGAPGSWLTLDDTGRVGRWDIGSGTWRHLATAARKGQLRLHADPAGRFAAVVEDHGRYGTVLDLGTGLATTELDGGDHHAEHVPFAFRFLERDGRALAVHRTAWNRLDVSDVTTGELLTAGEQDLDYFHGELHLSPGADRLLDDGWVWHPVGVPVVWSLDGGLPGNRLDVCAREYYWGHAMTWIGDDLVAIEGIGDDDEDMAPGARIFDVTGAGDAVEVTTIPGPTGRFFSDGRRLFSSDEAGLRAWDPRTGDLLATEPGFAPTHHDAVHRVLLSLGGDRRVRAATYF
ncbi:WD40 repeat domain-containing protein [Actinoplanes awajinensis]|uniref:Uncharacterized protein n=1 Tax=Actinoplanes awajinensis subsp. mycoplanecinus TaxID=135947 RepID=A0A101JDS9_9ACTN|nr:hypothetical protein [Actinoplanes awajinensis]KUL24831.1 hypothetical protein ADL15_41790 [Actinoplanes awajinensis subsp. mycoplanecinus]